MMFGSDRPQRSLKLGPRYAVWVEQSREWRGRLRHRYRMADLPSGLLRPSPVELNISDPAALESRLRELIGSEKKRGASTVLVLPDLCVRATLLEVDTLPTSPSERDALIRWRLGQESAFPLTGAKVVSKFFAPKTVLAAAIRETVLHQYETVCEAVGLCPVDVTTAGVVLWSALDVSGSCTEPVALLSLLDEGFTLAVHHDGRPTFLRTKVRSESGPDGVFQDVARSLAFYAETHPESPPRRLLLVSEEPTSDLERRVTEELNLSVIQVSGSALRPPTGDLDVRAMPVGALPAVAGLRKAPTRVNLSSDSRSLLRPVRAALALLSLLLAGLIVWDYVRAGEIEAQVAEVEKALARVQEQDKRLRLQAKAEGLDLSDAALQRLPREAAFANHVIIKRVFSWTRFLSDLEEAVPAHVAIQSIRLDSKGAMITLGGLALTLKDLTTLIISLEDHRAFQDAALVQHRVKENGRVEFGLTVRYTPSTRPDTLPSVPLPEKARGEGDD